MQQMVNINSKENSDFIWIKCSGCGEIIYTGELNRNFRICPKCNFYFPLKPRERLDLLADKKSLTIYTQDNSLSDFAEMDKIILTSEIKIFRRPLIIASIDLSFDRRNPKSEHIWTFINTKVIEAISKSAAKSLPFLLCINGTFHQFSTHLLAVNSIINKLDRAKLLFISILCQSDSQYSFPGFAYLADIIIAESSTSICFQDKTKINKNLPVRGTLQLYQNGLIDMIVPRMEMKHTIENIVSFFH